MVKSTQRAGNLPAETTSFIGRDHELADVRSRLTTSRLVSLVGPGGVGKTRLGIRAATDLARGFRDGAWLVELAEVCDPTLVGNAVLSALSLRDQSAHGPLALLLSYLRSRELLLVVDNCEHVVEAAAHLVSEIIKAAPEVRVIATSREPLSTRGECVVPVPPLELPSNALGAPDSLEGTRRNEAVTLFVERAAAAAGGFDLTSANQAAVVDLCRRLDGLPLAIELASVRTRVLSVDQILSRLTDRFGLLTGPSRAALPRHQTLRTTIDWSHELLEADERILLRRLSVFTGRFTLEDVEGVCAGPDVPVAGVLDLLSSLVDKSLVIKEEARAVACYRLHETMREYAVLRLRAADEEGTFQDRLAEYYVSWSLRSEPEIRQRSVWQLEWLDLELDNIASVLRRCLDQGDHQRGLELVISLGWYWITRANAEGMHWLDRMLVADCDHCLTHPRAYFMRGFLSVLQADPVTARPALDRAVRADRQRGDLSYLAQSLSMASVAANMADDRGAAERLLDQARSAAAADGHPAARLALLQAEALDGFTRGDLDAVRSASTEGVRLSEQTGDLYTLEIWTMNLGLAALTAGETDQAGSLLAEALRVACRIEDRVAQFYLVDALGCQAAGSGDHNLAAVLFGAAEGLRAQTGARVNAILAPLLAEATVSAVSALGRAAFDAGFQVGNSYDRRTAIAIALGEATVNAERTLAVPAAGARRSGPLSGRETEVARLVAGGMTNRQIGTRLFISERTVENHVRNIMNKLGVNSRAQIAGWITSTER